MRSNATLITRTYRVNNKTRTLDLNITQVQMDRYNSGMLAQRAFPNLSPSEREFIMTGMTDEDWNEIFPKETSND